MNLQTPYLGLTLRNPVVVGASPFCDDIDAAMRLEEAGAAALVMHSLFEEQIDLEEAALHHHLETPAESNYEATSYFPRYDEYNLTPSGYLRTLERLKSSLTIPVIASINGRRPGGWVDYARRLESAGADALELNTYQLATDPAFSGEDIEGDIVEILRNVTASVRIPVSVKLSPFHASLSHFAKLLDENGAAGLVRDLDNIGAQDLDDRGRFIYHVIGKFTNTSREVFDVMADGPPERFPRHLLLFTCCCKTRLILGPHKIAARLAYYMRLSSLQTMTNNEA